MIEAELPDGRILEFPDGTEPSVIQAAVKKMLAPEQPAQAAPAPTPQPEPEPSMAARIAANPLTRFATSAASPILGAGEWIPGPIGRFFAENNAELKRLVDEGKVDQGDLMKIAGGAADIAGTVMSPAFLKLAKVLPAAKTLRGMAAQGAGVGALGGALAPTGSADLKEKAIATGTGALVGGVATPVVSSLGRLATNAVGPIFSDAAAERGAARLVSKVAGPQRQSIVAQAFSGATPRQTAAEAALPTGIYEIPALQRLVGRGALPSEYGAVQAGEEAARLAALRSVTPDKLAAIEARQSAANALYGKAFSSDAQRLAELNRVLDEQALLRTGGIQVPSSASLSAAGDQSAVSKMSSAQKAYLGMADDIDQFALSGPKTPSEVSSVTAANKGPDYAPIRGSSVLPQIQAFEKNPVFQAAAKEAQKLAVTMGEEIGNPMSSLRGLHYIKLAIDNQFKSPTTPTALQNYQKGALQATKDRLLKAIEGVENEPGISPLYGLARKTFADMSPPVNQATILERMQAELRKPTDTGERVGAFLNVLGKGEDALIKKSTGMPRYVAGDLQKILTPQQMSVVDDIVGKLKQGEAITKQEREGMTATVKALRAELDPNTAPNLLNAKVSLFNAILRMLEGTGGKKVEKKLAEMMLPGRVPRLGELMQQYQANPYGMMSVPARMGGIPAAVAGTGMFGERE